ncbi:MAG: hypothetical protein K2X04_09320 [Burkholderiales bacterium]|nr:hypothetical protein [Burkholderiales bacterium]
MKLKNIIIMSAVSVGAIGVYGCSSGSSSSSTASGTYAYISDFGGNKLLQCSVNSNNGQLVNCQNIAQPNTLNAPTGIALNNGQIYVNNSGFNSGFQSVQSSSIQCALSGGIATLSGCLVSSPTGVSNPIGFTINGSYAYIANYFGGPGYTKPGSYTWCSLEQSTGNLTNCNTESAPGIAMESSATPEVITINNNTTIGNSVAYVTDQQNAGYSYCKVSNIDGSLNSCSFESLVAGSGGITPIGPRQMTIINGYAYFADSGNTGGGTKQFDSAYTLCNVSPTDGKLSHCSTQQTSPGQLNSPTGIAINGNYVYITNENGPAGESVGYSYTMCNISESGFLANCNNYVPQGITNPNYAPPGKGVYLTYIAFGSN